ncbi:MAG: hypothetical protein LBV61_03690, partial [Burkholderiaceae bacterium]|nr:hypothetical protein [Burkholderiaceae bacterium]
RGERGTRSATFLPAVWRQLPQPADFLRHLLNKGGFSAWPADMQLGLYTVHEHHEPEAPTARLAQACETSKTPETPKTPETAP